MVAQTINASSIGSGNGRHSFSSGFFWACSSSPSSSSSRTLPTHVDHKHFTRILTVVAGASSYTSLFQTPVSIFLRSSWRNRHRIFVPFKRALQRMRFKLPPRSRRLPTNPLMTIQIQRSVPSPRSRVVCSTSKMNADDVRCVSWILRYITDPEALDAAIPFAATIWCFDSTGELYPGSGDRAYHSGRAMAWIHTLAMCNQRSLRWNSLSIRTTNLQVLTTTSGIFCK